MAAVLRIAKNCLERKIYSYQLFRVLPVVQETKRCLSDKTSKTIQDKTSNQQSSTQQVSYKVPEYYSHNVDTYADMEVTIANYRQPQPDPRVPYYHHYPWEKKSS